MTSDCKIEIVTRFDTDYFFIESRNNKKFNCNTKFQNTNKNIFLKYLATKTIESKTIEKKLRKNGEKNEKKAREKGGHAQNTLPMTSF